MKPQRGKTLSVRAAMKMGLPSNHARALVQTQTLLLEQFNSTQEELQFLVMFCRSYLLSHAETGQETHVLYQFAANIIAPGIDIGAAIQKNKERRQ